MQYNLLKIFGLKELLSSLPEKKNSKPLRISKKSVFLPRLFETPKWRL